MTKLKRVFQAIKMAVQGFVSDDCLRMAAALAYYTIFSLAPLMVLIISVAGFFISPEDVSRRLKGEIEAVVGPQGAEQVQTMVDHANQGRKGVWGTVIGAVVLMFGATGVMVQLQAALNEVWEVSPEEIPGGMLGIIMKRILSLGMILTFAFLILISLVANMILSGLGEQINQWIPGEALEEGLRGINGILSYAMITAMFAALYRYLPDRHVSYKYVWLGSALTAFLFVIAQMGLSWYLARFDIASTYGAAGAFALILIWVYYSAIIFLFGAEFIKTWSQQQMTLRQKTLPQTLTN